MFLRSKFVIGIILFFVLSISAVVNPYIKGICYSPFRDGQSPNGASPTREQIIEDISLIKFTFPNATIRMFGIDKDYLKWIPEICESLSVDYIIAGWTSFQYNDTWVGARNDINNFLKVADSLQYTHLKGILYGYNNTTEVHPSFPTEADKVAKIISEINATKLILDSNAILSHEENWDVWLRHPGLADSLTFVSLRIIPQSDLVPIGEAVQYIRSCYDTVKKVFPTKEVVVTSVGWNTYQTSESAQKIFLKGLTADTLLNCYIFSFADELWKGSQEGYYGMFNSKRLPKLFLQDSLILDFSNLFVKDSTRLEGLLYSFNAFAYPSDISLVALQKDIGRWADTLAEIAQITFFRADDFKKADGTIPSIFEANGNKKGIITSSYAVDPGILQNNSFNAILLPSVPYISGYGSKDSVQQEKIIDLIRNQILVIRKDSKNDSVFIAPTVGNFNGWIDSLIKYPELLKEFDGLVFSTNLYEFRDTPNVEIYIDSLLSKTKRLCGTKKMIVFINIWCLDCAVGDGDVPIYNAFANLKEKYNFNIIYGHIGEMYTHPMVAPDLTYKFLMPWRFSTQTNNFFVKTKNNISLKLIENNLFIKIPKRGMLSIFDLKGRMIKKMQVKKTATINLNSLGIGNGIWLLKLRANGEEIKLKILLNK